MGKILCLKGSGLVQLRLDQSYPDSQLDLSQGPYSPVPHINWVTRGFLVAYSSIFSK